MDGRGRSSRCGYYCVPENYLRMKEKKNRVNETVWDSLETLIQTLIDQNVSRLFHFTTSFPFNYQTYNVHYVVSAGITECSRCVIVITVVHETTNLAITKVDLLIYFTRYTTSNALKKKKTGSDDYYLDFIFIMYCTLYVCA